MQLTMDVEMEIEPAKEEVRKETVEENCVDVAKETVEENGGNIAEETIEENGGDVAKVTVEEHDGDVAEETIEENGGDVAEETVEKNGEKITEVKNNFKFKKRLALQVRRHCILYNTLHKQFSNAQGKEEAWLKISKALKTDVDICKNTWIDLRYDYQSYVRRLRKFYRCGNKNQKHRPTMILETDMLFLWRFISDRSVCKLPYKEPVDNSMDVTENSVSQNEPTAMVVDDDDDDLVLIEDKPIIIDLDADDANDIPKQYGYIKLTKENTTLIDLVRVYQELYNTKHKFFFDYKRKGIIWNAIANELNDKATKLMKIWIQMQTRYEWEINQRRKNGKSGLEEALEFLKPHITKNRFTVYKQSAYLKKSWQDPIEHFKNIFNLLAVMKKYPFIVNITEDQLYRANKSDEFHAAWKEIAKIRGSKAGQCETTWLILRLFYRELMYMRKSSYQLQDKWYFESIITDLYAQADSVRPPQKTTKPAVPNGNKVARAAGTESSSGTPTPPPMVSTPPLLTLQDLPSPITAINLNIDEDTINATLIHNKHGYPQTQPLLPNANISQVTDPQLQFPRITSAKSLAPSSLLKPLVAKGLQIKPIGQMLASNAQMPAISQAISSPNNSIIGGGTMVISSVTSLANMSDLPTISSSSISMRTTPTTNHNDVASLHLPYTLPKYTKVIAVPTTTNSSTAYTPLPTEPPIVSITPEVPSLATPHPEMQHDNMTPITNVRQNNILAAAAAVSAAAAAIPVAVVNPVYAPATSQLPKITGALSLLSANEIMIELIASSNGNQLVVHGPPLAEKYLLSMEKTAKFIRAVMAIPLLHNKNISQPTQVNTYWQILATKFDLPAHVCKAIWNFLSENFNHFPKIAPMEELMRPFKTDLKVWKESHDLFQKFDANAIRSGCLKYKKEIPKLMAEVGKHPCLYQDIAKFSNSSPTTPQATEANVSQAWQEIREKFPEISKFKPMKLNLNGDNSDLNGEFLNVAKLVEIYTEFKNIFLRYMWSLECGIDNKWPQNWWSAFAQMTYLMESRYSRTEAFYYIVRNKMIEEIDRCNTLAVKSNAENEILREETQNIIRSNILNASSDNEGRMVDIYCDETLPAPSTNSQPTRVRYSNINVTGNTYNLILSIHRHREIYETKSIPDAVRERAWCKVAGEMNTTVGLCRKEFMQALRRYRLHAPVASRCRLNLKYFKYLNEIYCGVKQSSKSKLSIKTPSELNQSVDSSTDTVFPERFIPEISMSNSPVTLVMKNWAYGIGCSTYKAQESVERDLRALFDKYRPLANGT